MINEILSSEPTAGSLSSDLCMLALHFHQEGRREALESADLRGVETTRICEVRWKALADAERPGAVPANGVAAVMDGQVEPR